MNNFPNLVMQMSDTSLPNAIHIRTPNVFGIYDCITEIKLSSKNIDDSCMNGIFQDTMSVGAFNVVVGWKLSYKTNKITFFENMIKYFLNLN